MLVFSATHASGRAIHATNNRARRHTAVKGGDGLLGEPSLLFDKQSSGSTRFGLLMIVAVDVG
jgi:hypothetical protein